jgi:hypothetical protein
MKKVGGMERVVGTAGTTATIIGTMLRFMINIDLRSTPQRP